MQHDESPHNTISGVFPGGTVAAAFAEEIKDQIENGVLHAQFVIGYPFDDNSARPAASDCRRNLELNRCSQEGSARRVS